MILAFAVAVTPDLADTRLIAAAMAIALPFLSELAIRVESTEAVSSAASDVPTETPLITRSPAVKLLMLVEGVAETTERDVEDTKV